MANNKNLNSGQVVENHFSDIRKMVDKMHDKTRDKIGAFHDF